MAKKEKCDMSSYLKEKGYKKTYYDLKGNQKYPKEKTKSMIERSKILKNTAKNWKDNDIGTSGQRRYLFQKGIQVGAEAKIDNIKSSIYKNRQRQLSDKEYKQLLKNVDNVGVDVELATGGKSYMGSNGKFIRVVPKYNTTNVNEELEDEFYEANPSLAVNRDYYNGLAMRLNREARRK